MIFVFLFLTYFTLYDPILSFEFCFVFLFFTFSFHWIKNRTCLGMPVRIQAIDEAFLKSWEWRGVKMHCMKVSQRLCFHVTTWMCDKNVFLWTHNLVSQKMSWGRHPEGGRLRRGPRCKRAQQPC